MFTWTVSVVPHARSQSVRLSQGPIQRKLGLADIDVHTSSG
ncbi:PH domain-containing protein, partial [Cronobacter sakazakii]